MDQDRNDRQAGFSLVEFLIALALFAVIAASCRASPRRVSMGASIDDD